MKFEVIRDSKRVATAFQRLRNISAPRTRSPGAPKPELLQSMDFSPAQGAEEVSGDIPYPSLVTDTAGRTRWRLPGASQSENLQIGVGNVQALFVASFPEFATTFQRTPTGEIVPEQREQATEFILERIGRQPQFRQVIGNSPLSVRIAPYFEGTFKAAVRKSFMPLGIQAFEEYDQEPRYRIFESTFTKAEVTIPATGEQVSMPVPRDRGGKIRWAAISDIESLKLIILSEALRIISPEDQAISQKSFQQNGEMKLVDAIDSYYLGGWNQFTRDFQAYRPHTTVMRRSEYSWTAPGFTDEQNLELGIKNVQTIFLSRFPEFNGLFERNEEGKIREDQRPQALDFIIKNLLSAKKFNENISRPATTRLNAPYFEGSHFVAIKKSFAPWGITFEYLDQIPDMGRGTWWSLLEDHPEQLARVIEREAKKCQDAGIKLSRNTMREAGQGKLADAIKIYYPGGFRGLNEKYKSSEDLRAPNGFWASDEGQERIRSEAREFLETHKTIGNSILSKNDRGYLYSTAHHFYQGGWPQLLKDIGFTQEPKLNLEELPLESRKDVLDAFANFIASNPDSKVSLLEYAIKYMKGRF